MEPHLCRLASALGRTRECREERCSFWHDDVCILAGLHSDLERTEGLPQLLLRLRNELDDARGVDHRLLPPGLR